MEHFIRTSQLLTAILLLSIGSPGAFASDSVRILDDGDTGFSLVNPTQWYTTTRLGYNADYRAGWGSGTAIWTFTVNPGSYRVSITWYDAGYPYDTYNATAAPVSVLQGSTVLKSTTLNFRTKPSDFFDAGVGWKNLGVFNITATSIQVRVSATASLFSIADAVRIERTDGTAISSPVISGLSPLNSPLPGGIPVRIFGKNFTSGSRVLFGSRASSQVTFVSSSELRAVAPPNAPGSVSVKVITPEGLSAVSSSTFKYAIGRTVDDGEPGFAASAPAYTVSKIGFQNDYVLPGGTARYATAVWSLPVNTTPYQRVAVTWYNAGAPYNAGYASSVRFDIMDGPNLLASVAGNLQQTPSDFYDLGTGWKQLGYFKFPLGQLKVVLRNNTDYALMADAIRVEEVIPAPVLTSVSPNYGTVSGGTKVVLSGSRFLPGARVKFGSTLAPSVTYSSSTSLTAVTPSSVAGTVSVTVINPDGKSGSLANAYTFKSLTLAAVRPEVLPAITEPTRLAIERTPGAVVLRWPGLPDDYVLEEATTVEPFADWAPTGTQPDLATGESTLSVDPEAPAKFYRLRKRE